MIFFEILGLVQQPWQYPYVAVSYGNKSIYCDIFMTVRSGKVPPFVNYRYLGLFAVDDFYARLIFWHKSHQRQIDQDLGS